MHIIAVLKLRQKMQLKYLLLTLFFLPLKHLNHKDSRDTYTGLLAVWEGNQTFYFFKVLDFLVARLYHIFIFVDLLKEEKKKEKCQSYLASGIHRL